MKLRRLAILLAAVALLLGTASVLVLRSRWLEDQVRNRIATAVEDATGGRVEIGAFVYNWHDFTASVAPFVLHGTESTGSPPLFRAAKVEIGLRIVSFVKRSVDLTYLTIEKPQVFIQIDPQGHTNLPIRRERREAGKLEQQLIDLRVQRFQIRDGFVDINSRRTPVDGRADKLAALFSYDPKVPGYAGNVQSKALELHSRDLPLFLTDLNANLLLDSAGLRIGSAHFGMAKSKLDVSGVVTDLASPHGSFDLQATLDPLPVLNNGQANFTGKAMFQSSPNFDWWIEGNARARGLTYLTKWIQIRNATLNTSVKLRPTSLELPAFTLGALGGEARGRLTLADWSRLAMKADTRGVALQSLRASDLSATAGGLVDLTASIADGTLRNLEANAQLTLDPGPGPIPVKGIIDIGYRQTDSQIRLGDSALDIGGSHVEASGILGQVLKVRANTSDPQELLAALPIFGEPIPASPPIQLKGGAHFDGTVVGPLDNPAISGQLDATNFTVKINNVDNSVDHLSAAFELSSSSATARTLAISQGPFHLDGKGHVGLSRWKPQDASPMTASLTLRGAQIATLLADRGSKIPVTGVLAGTAELSGTFGSPQATAGVDAENVVAYGEPLKRVRASVIVSGDTVQVIDARLEAAAGQLQGKGRFQHPPADFTTGQFQFDLTGRSLNLAQIQHVQQQRKGLGGLVDVNAVGTASLAKAAFRVLTIASDAKVRDVSLDGHRYGTLALTAKDHGTLLDLRATADLLGTPVQGSGEWKLEGDDPGHGEILIPRITVDTLHRLVPNPERKTLPFEGFLEGRIAIEGSLRKPDQLKAEIRLDSMQINSSPGVIPRAGAQARDLVVRNAAPILLSATRKEVIIRSARLTGTDTTLEASGKFSFDESSPWDLRAKGSINLAILQLFNANLLGSGVSTVDAAIRGSLNEPQVEGRLELKNASLYVSDLPNGLDQANGVILFDRNRATVDSLAATTGGGRVIIRKGSFVGFRGPSLLYRVQGEADNVRYRSPEGVSVTVSGLLNLIGSSDNSVLSGTLTVVRAGFNPTTDIGRLLANTAKPVSSPVTPNEYLRGIQFDVRVESAQSLEVQTSLTRNLDAEMNLRIRGNLERPVVLGNLSVNEGEIEFFGNRYTINRGEVNFYNPVKIEPILDMDLETQVRGITVDITFSGPLSKLNFSYRSDPPLQTNDIIALLAVGRTPVTTGASASSQTTGSTNYLGTGGTNALLSQAISAPVSGRLQRFFGVSHIKIDPQLTDLTSVPQARLTLEQQISKDITLTYITNLTRTQEQIIRVEWDLNRQWSVIALRDENGAFGIDFQFRKRFK